MHGSFGKVGFGKDGEHLGAGVMHVTEAQLDRLGTGWAAARVEADRVHTTGPDCARLAELAVATAAVARRLQRPKTAEQVIGQTLASLQAACARAPRDLPRHLAFARVLEAAAWHEQKDARASFDALRASAAVLHTFASAVGDASSEPLARLAVTTALLRPLMHAARMLDDAPLRRQTWQKCWEAAIRWAKASHGGPDHTQAVEWVVLLAFELAADELDESAAACLERCEELRGHLDELVRARNGDAVALLHRSAFHRLLSDAWFRLGDWDESTAALDECQRVLAKLDAVREGDAVAIEAQRAALVRDRAKLEAQVSKRSAAAAGA